MLLPITEVKVSEERFRHDFGDLKDLAESILKFGLLQPIVIDRDNNLICGERRFKACQMAGLEEITVHFIDEMDPLRLKEMELEENIRRKDFTWHEEVEAKRQLHLLKSTQAAFAGQPWTMADTAKIANDAVGNLNTDIQLADAVLGHPELLFEKNKSRAFKKFKQLEREEALTELRKRAAEKGLGKCSEFFFNADCLEFLPKQPANFVNLIITDPPWGVDIETSSNIGEKAEYVDTTEYMKTICSIAYSEMFRVLKPGGHLYIFYGAQYYGWHLSQLLLAGFEVDEIPGIWNKTTHGGSNPVERESNAYEPYLHAWKNSPGPLQHVVPNVHTHNRVPSEKRIHTAEKPQDLLKELIENCTVPGELVGDFFAGSAATLRAAIALGRCAIGCELSGTVYEKALYALEEEARKCGGFMPSTLTE